MPASRFLLSGGLALPLAMDVELARIAFTAALAGTTPIRVGDDGARIVLEIPESDLPAALRMVVMRGKALRITVEPLE